jgi:undecaprenyl-phosphate galactose phosphotransferase
MHRQNKLRLLSRILNVLFLITGDFVCVFLMFEVAVFLRVHVLPMIYSGFPIEPPVTQFSKIWWIFPVWLFFFFYEGLYIKRFSFWDEINSLWKVAFFSTVGVLTIVTLGKLIWYVSRTSVILMGLLSLLFIPLVRFSIKRLLLRYPLFRRRVLILGAGKTGNLIYRALMKEPNYGYDIMGFLDDDPGKVGRKIDGLKVHRGVERASSYLKSCSITDVIIAMPGAGKEKLQHLINSLQHKVERILFVPDMYGIAVIGTSLQHFFHEQAFALELKNNLARPVNIILKRFFDLIMSLILLPLVFLSVIIIGILIKLDSPGSVVFSQERVGKRGKTFRCMKFRTMYVDAEERLKAILGTDPAAMQEWGKHYKLRDDPRVTRVGKFLRTTSLDELPQLFHVLSGRMSLVGPRPVTQQEINDYYKEAAELCFSVPPGITGLWQVTGRSGTTYEHRIGLDSWYVRNWNVWLDIVILFKTVKVVILREGAY